MNIYLDDPNIGNIEKEYMVRALESGFVSTVGPFVPEFEEGFAKYIQSAEAVSTQSGTAALHMALHELGIGEGDEVIVPVLTFAATVNPVLYVGATPVFADVDGETWNVDPSEIKKNITKATKAIIPVHLYGNPCDMEAIMRIAKRHRLYVIEDATESLGATYHGGYTGTFGDFGCFSFNGNKIITTGGGGMIVGNDAEGLAHIRYLINQAKDASRGDYHEEVGFNYRMTNIEAALGMAQLERLDDFLRKKRTFRAIYEQELSDVLPLTFQMCSDGTNGSYWFTAVAVDEDINIPLLQKELGKRGISTRRVFMPLSEFPCYVDYKSGEYSNAYTVYENGLCLPSSTLNSEENVRYMCRIFSDIIG